MPHADETPETTVGELPLLDHLIAAEGASDLAFEGISFQHTTWCEKRHLFWSFPYVCPEPVLAKCLFYLYYIMAQKCRFFRRMGPSSPLGARGKRQICMHIREKTQHSFAKTGSGRPQCKLHTVRDGIHRFRRYSRGVHARLQAGCEKRHLFWIATQTLHTKPAETRPFLSAFPMFVPSLSWPNDRFYIEMAQKCRFSQATVAPEAARTSLAR